MKKKISHVLLIFIILFPICYAQVLYRESRQFSAGFKSLFDFYSEYPLFALGGLAESFGQAISCILIAYVSYLLIKLAYWLIKKQRFNYFLQTMWIISIAVALFTVIFQYVLTVEQKKVESQNSQSTASTSNKKPLPVFDYKENKSEASDQSSSSDTYCKRNAIQVMSLYKSGKVSDEFETSVMMLKDPNEVEDAILKYAFDNFYSVRPVSEQTNINGHFDAIKASALFVLIKTDDIKRAHGVCMRLIKKFNLNSTQIDNELY